MNRRTLLLTPPAALLAASAGAADSPEFVVATGRRQLFLDDAGVAAQERVTRTLHQPEKRGAVLRSPHPRQTVQTRTAPIWDPELQKWRLYVLSVDQNLWESPDGVNWAPGPVTNQRIDMAVRDAGDPDAQRRYKAPLTNTGFVVSPDGVHWTRTPTPAVPSSDEANFSYDPRDGRFLHSVKRRGPFGRALALATSRDFRTWEDYGLVFHTDERDQELGRRKIAARLANPGLQRPELDVPAEYSVQVYNMGVFWYEGVYLGMPSLFHQSGRVTKDWPDFDRLGLSPAMLAEVRKYGDWTGYHEVQLVASRDLKNWQRVAERRPFLENSPLGAGAYDIQTIIGPSAPIVRDQELWFYYTGIKQYALIRSGNTPGYADYMPDKGAICLAVLRRDGFVSLDAGEQAGQVVTKSFRCPGGRLHVNADSAQGEVRVEALDEAGKTLATSAPLAGDHLWTAVRWPGEDVAAHRGRRIALRFHLRRARLYAYGVE